MAPATLASREPSAASRRRTAARGSAGRSGTSPSTDLTDAVAPQYPRPVLALLPDFLDTERLIDAFGLIGIWTVVFAESGLLIGFFLPGDALLFTAGFFASNPASIDRSLHLPLWPLVIGIWIAAIAG